MSLVLAAGAGAGATVDGELGPDEIVFPSAVGEVWFPHRLHAEDLGTECVECHHETDAAVLEHPHAQYFEDFWIRCPICHHETQTRAQPVGCDACHHREEGRAADETLSAKVVIHLNCWSCHEIGTGAEASRGCGSCHRAPASGRRATSP